MCILLPLDALAQEPPGTFVNECRDRHFWMKTKKSFLIGGNFRFDIIDNDGIHALDDRYAASCGFTYSFNIPGDLIFRASFLACHVSSKNDAEFGLRFRFARIDQFGRETYYPFSMRCSTAQPWYPREIVCEENYMEARPLSRPGYVRRNVPEIAHEGIGTEDWPAAVPAAQEAFMSVWQVVFHKTGQPAKPMDPSLAHSRGYRINSTSTRILFRSPFNMPESEMLTQSVFFFETWFGSNICMLGHYRVLSANQGGHDNGTFDGMNLAWVSPRVLSPLVLHIEKFQDKGISMGVDGRLLDLATIRRRNYDLKVNETFIQISIPYGAEGGYLKSRVINNQYNRLYAIDLYLEHQWADDQWEATQHRSLKPVHTIPEEKVFTVTLGIFNPDVELKNLTINGVPLTLPEAVNQGIVVTEVQHPNGTKSFVLKVPFTHPLIPQKYVGDGVREFTLNINYTLNILPENEPYFHPATIVCWVKDVVLPVIKGSCTENSIVFEGTHGNMDYFWVVYIGKHELTSELAANRGYIFTNLTKFIVEVPVFSVGCICEYVGDGVREFTLNINYTLNILPENEPYFHPATIVCRVKDVLLPVIKGSCTENSIVFEGTHGNMDYFWVVYIGKHQLTSELAANRGYIFTNLTKFIVEVPVFSVGCICEIVGNYLIYENEVVYTRALFPPNAPVITRDSEYRLTIRCRYFLNDTVKLLAERKAVPVPYSGKEGLGSLEFNPYSQGSGGSLKFRDVLNLTARIARDVSYSQFYSAFPVSQSVLEPLFLEVELLHPQNLSDQLILQDCWATETPELDASPQWDLVTDSCLTSGDSYKTQFHPVSASALTKSPYHLQRLEVQAHSAEDQVLWKQVYLHCLAVVCDSEKAVACNKTCITGVKRSAHSVELADSVKGYISAGPVQIAPEGGNCWCQGSRLGNSCHCGSSTASFMYCTKGNLEPIWHILGLQFPNSCSKLMLIPGTLQKLATTLLTNSCAFKLEPFMAY
ncbi:UNVERIFIED_CONTAM: hypothetical protein FKN15_015967 [Acipenser sinensis]